MPISRVRSLLPFLLLAVTMAATPARTQAQDRRLAERLDPTTAVAVQRLIDSARTLGLPTEPLVQRALEGRTFGASGDRIRTAVGALFGQLGRAHDALGDGASLGEVTAAAEALRAGLPTATLQQLRSLRTGRSLVVPISVLTDLISEGMPADRATRSVLDLAKGGGSDEEFLALRRRMRDERQRSPATPQPEPPTLRPAPDPPPQP